MKQYIEGIYPVEYGPTGIHHHISHFKQPWLLAHWHDQMELIRLRQGEMTVGCEDVVVLKPGDIYIIPPKMPHYVVCCDEETVYDVVMFDVRAYYNGTEMCREWLEPLFDGRAKFRLCVHQQEISDCFDRLIAPTQANGFEKMPIIYTMLDMLFRYALVEIGTDVKGRHSVIRATEYMKENLAEQLTTKQLAKQFGYSQEHFCRLFKEVTRFTPMQYVKIFRMEKAMNMLKEDKYTVGEIACLCGFTDPNYFTRCFREFFGTTPTQIRKS